MVRRDPEEALDIRTIVHSYMTYPNDMLPCGTVYHPYKLGKLDEIEPFLRN